MVHARSSTRPPIISTLVGVNVYKEPFINKEQASLYCLFFKSINDKSRIVDLYLEGFFVAVLFFKIRIKLYLNFQPSFVLPYHSYMYQK